MCIEEDSQTDAVEILNILKQDFYFAVNDEVLIITLRNNKDKNKVVKYFNINMIK